MGMAGKRKILILTVGLPGFKDLAYPHCVLSPLSLHPRRLGSLGSGKGALLGFWLGSLYSVYSWCLRVAHTYSSEDSGQ